MLICSVDNTHPAVQTFCFPEARTVLLLSSLSCFVAAFTAVAAAAFVVGRFLIVASPPNIPPLPRILSHQIWSLPSQRFVCTLNGHNNWVRCATFRCGPAAALLSSSYC